MKVIFDFDDVLFNAKAFKQEMFWFLEGKGYLKVRDIYEAVRLQEKPFSLRVFLQTLDVAISFEKQEEYYREILDHAAHLVNEEVFSVMKSIGKDHCFIVTNGVPDFQLDKIRKSIGENAAQEIFVVSGGKREAIKKLCKQYENEEVIFVDDKLAFLNDLDLEECRNLKTVLFNENGLTNLLAEIKASQKEEVISEGFYKEQKEYSKEESGAPLRMY